MAGVSIRSLHLHFPIKEALAAAVIDRHDSETMQLYGNRSSRWRRCQSRSDA
jgi:AcrR family transcriptional regulator